MSKLKTLISSAIYLQLTKTPMVFMDLDDAFHICQARICSYLISLLWAEVKSFATSYDPVSAFCPYLDISAGEGNGTPLQYSCLENPMDGGAW